MQRTYKSKKDVGGGLDHRDMLLTVDEKSSVFDAFYIQNIKQTKRELSCMGASNHHGVSSNKVRKRKYVKRIVKDIEPIARESLSASVFLTPDKSIHVKKAPDPFDQLLNSSPAPFEAKKDNLFDQLFSKPAKAYTRKKKPQKSYNYTSNDSIDSDKENTKKDKTNDTQNVTDIRTHEFVIEKESKPSPILDNSINNIVKKISQLNNLSHRSSNDSIKKTFRSNMNRLTSNLQSPLLRSSPLSSTPFTDKHRSKSIYKFSPIPIKDLEDSPNYVTITEENDRADESIIFIPKKITDTPMTSTNDNFTSSPLTHLSNNKKFSCSSKSLFSTTDKDSSSNICNNLNSEIKEITPVEVAIKSKEISYIDTSPVQTSEVKPFLGFSTTEAAVVPENDQVLIENEDYDKSIVFSVKSAIKETSDLVQNRKTDDIYEKENTKDESVVSNVDNTVPSEPFLGFTKVETEDDLSSDSEVHNLSDTAPYENRKSATSLIVNIVNENNSAGSQDTHVSDEDTSTVFQDVERESLYDTCNSEQSCSTAEEILIKEPTVVIKKMDLAVFMDYYKKSTHNKSDNLEYSKNSDEYSHSENCYSSDNLSAESSENEGSKENETDISNSFNDEKHSSSDDEAADCISINQESEAGKCLFISEEDHDSSDEEDRGISFVTTRRRNDFTNNASLLVLDDTMASASSTDGDKTVISNKCNLKQISSPDIVVNVTLNTEEKDKDTTLINTSPIISNTVHLEDTKEEPRISTITTRKSVKLFKQNTLPGSPEYRKINEHDKPGIILQPGKKWERSLSIYRRMTMMADRFDHTLLEDEDLHAKGRKYRQSVINTMEMQEYNGSLHNESIHSRRSTFVSKPCRSTIRIVKEPNTSSVSLCNATVLELDDLKGFLEDCDDTVVELSKLSISGRERDITVLEKFHEANRVAPARDYVLRRCNQTDTILFDECYPDAVLKNCRKIGEGVYGEVYLWRATDGRARVMKIVPIAGTTKVNGEHQKDFHEIISEIVIAMELSALRAPIAEIECHFDEGKDDAELDLHSVENATDVFNEVLAVRCVYGGYPSRLLDLWELYDETRGSENDNPAVLPADQQYIVLELANAGQDLESYQFNSAEQAHALFLQVAFGLAVGEEAFQFEHRDLHWGNVLIAPTDQKWATFVLRGRAHRVARRGVAATIIDYSLSRLSLPLAGGAPGERDAAALYNDLVADPGLFDAVGDYQFEVYRLMRDKLGNEWKNFEPYTNILWLHYTVDKMITALRYKRTNTKTHKQYIAKLKAIKGRILSYGSACQFVLTDNEY